jgi:hypothetical protein
MMDSGELPGIIMNLDEPFIFTISFTKIGRFVFKK